MKKLIITIFIIFAYGIPQVFAVIPPMNRYLFWFNNAGERSTYVNNYASYVNSANEIRWYIDNNNKRLTVTVNSQTYPIDVKILMQEAFIEWKDAFTRRNITFVPTNDVNEATIRISVDHETDQCVTHQGDTHFATVLANYRGAFEYNQEYGNMVFYEKCFQRLMEDVNYRNKIKEATGRTHITVQEVLNYLVRFKAKHHIGYLFGVSDTVPYGGSAITMYLVHANIHNYNQAIFQTRILMINMLIFPTEPVSIMVRNIVDYLRYLHTQLGRAVGVDDIDVTTGDRAMVRDENTCFQQPQNPAQTEGTINVNCNTTELNAVIDAYGANNTARTTALTSQA